MLCESLVLSQLHYCDTVYGPCLNSLDINRIQKLQNSCLRLIFGVRKYEHISHTLKQVNWLNMKNRRYLHSACQFYAVLLNQSPTYLFKKISYRCDVHHLNTRFRGTLTPPSFSTELFRRSFTYNIVKCINNLPDELKGVKIQINSFKKRLSILIMDKQESEHADIG